MGNLAAEPNILVRRQRVRFWIGTGRASKVYPALILKISIWVVLKTLDSADSVGAGMCSVGLRIVARFPVQKSRR